MTKFAGITIEESRPAIKHPVAVQSFGFEEYKPVPDPRVYLKGVTVQEYRQGNHKRRFANNWRG